jgi:hypothetical protein
MTDTSTRAHARDKVRSAAKLTIGSRRSENTTSWRTQVLAGIATTTYN